MTLTQILFDGQPDGTAASSGNLPGNSGFSVVSPSTCTYSAAVGMRGSTGLHFVITTATAIVRYNLAADNDVVSVSFILTTPTTNPTVFANALSLRTGSGRAMSVGISPNGRLYVQDSANATTYVTPTVGTLTGGGKYRVELRAHGNSTTAATINCAVYNPTDTSSPISTMTPVTNANLTAATLHQIELGNSAPAAIDFGIDDLQFDDGRATEIGPIIVSSSSLRPSSVDSNAGSWTNVGGLADIAAALADESDSTFAQGADNPGTPGKVVVLKYAGNLASGQPTVKTRYQASGSSPALNLQVELLQGPNTAFTQIATRTIAGASTSVTDHSFQCTSGEAATITDRTNLYVRYTETS